MKNIGFQTREGRADGRGRRVGIVASRFHAEIVDRLVEGALSCLREHGVAADDLSVHEVPGAWEIPLALEHLATSDRFDALVALGVVLRGETPHFEYVCRGCADGVQRVSLAHRLPVGFGVLTCDTRDQADARAGGEAGNKGWEAALAALEMIGVLTAARPLGFEVGEASRS
jgi:6,7-dimethyl-8-ribityllumazine synthase